MRKFIKKVLYFGLAVAVLVACVLLLPATPRASESLIVSNVQKDSLLQNVDSPRIIFVGGSNLSFGLNSQLIKDSLYLNPVNTGVHVCIGLVYMMDNALNYIQAGDVVILVPEYMQFYDEIAYGGGGQELARTVFDVDNSKMSLLGARQWWNVLGMLPKYFSSKFNYLEYFTSEESEIYKKDAYNEFGDAYKHWTEKKKFFYDYGILGAELNLDVFEYIKGFHSAVQEKGARLFISYPAYQDISFEKCEKQIEAVESELKKIGITILGTPQRYKTPDSIHYDTPYHLIKSGVDYRTQLFIEDYSKVAGDR